MKVEMEVYRAEAVGKITLEAMTVEAAKAKAIAVVNAHEVPLEPIVGGVAIRVIRITR